MIARGDLGVEIPPEDVPGRQKEIIRLCRQHERPVIVATQMLELMIGAPTPRVRRPPMSPPLSMTAPMPSCCRPETAAGRFPVEAVAMMERILRRTEAHAFYAAALGATAPTARTPAQAIAAAAIACRGALGFRHCRLLLDRRAGVRLAARPPGRPVIVLSSDLRIARRLSLVWGTRADP